MSLSAIPRSLRSQVAERDGGRCRYCRLAQRGQAGRFHINHVIPRSRGGATALDNLVLQCPACSLRKANKVVAADPVSGDVVGLFHPLLQAWDEHFSLDGSGKCDGLTSAGRATVIALRMNDPHPSIARFLQIRLGLLAPTV